MAGLHGFEHSSCSSPPLLAFYFCAIDVVPALLKIAVVGCSFQRDWRTRRKPSVSSVPEKTGRLGDVIRICVFSYFVLKYGFFDRSGVCSGDNPSEQPVAPSNHSSARPDNSSIYP